MLSYEFDKETTDLLRYSLALYKFKGYVGGFDQLIKYYAAICFEKMILTTGKRYNHNLQTYLSRKYPDRPEWQKPSAGDVIHFLYDSGLVDSFESKTLQQYWRHRASIMHADAEEADFLANIKTLNLLKFLCNKKGLEFQREIDKLTFEDISAFGEGQKFSIIDKEFRGFSYYDFDNLQVLYKKCQGLRKIMENKLINSPLKATAISGFTYDVGSIWLPWVLNPGSDPRAHIRKASLGIVFTPLNVRISLDFGPLAFKQKKAYLAMLINGDLDDCIKELSAKDSLFNYSFCNTIWFYNIISSWPLNDFLEHSTSSRENLACYVKDTENLEKSFLNQEDSESYLITKNQYLLGKVENRFPSSDDPDRFIAFVQNLGGEALSTFEQLTPLLRKIESYTN